jgi:transglutaminase-like putative cysteine protease
VLRVAREELPLAMPLPIAASDEARAFLAPSPLIESDDAAIVARARAIVGDTRDAIAAARRLVDWVATHVEKAPTLTVPSAREVLSARRGDCNEHAALLTALARAAGIPARVVAGTVYAGDGFYYHAWTELWFGRWVSADSVFAQLPADATHVKLALGDAEHYATLAGMIGKLAFALEEAER